MHEDRRGPVQPGHHERRDPGDEHRAAPAQAELPAGDRPEGGGARTPGGGEEHDRLRVERGHHRAAGQPGGRRGEQVHTRGVEPGRRAGDQVDGGELPRRPAPRARDVRGLQDVHDHVVFLRPRGERADAREPGPRGDRDAAGDHHRADERRDRRTQLRPCTRVLRFGTRAACSPERDGGDAERCRRHQECDRAEREADRRDEHRDDPRHRDRRRGGQRHHQQPGRDGQRGQQHQPRHVRDGDRDGQDRRVGHRLPPSSNIYRADRHWTGH